MRINGQTFRAIIFDMDGVIVDTRNAHQEAWMKYAESLGQSIDPDDFMRKTFGRGNLQVVPYFFPDRKDDHDFLKEEGEKKEQMFLEIFRSGVVPPIDGLFDFLKVMEEASIPMAVGSSAPRMNIEAILRGLKIDHYFSSIVSSDEVIQAKPDPSIFLECAQQMNQDAENCIVLEDSIHGLEAAKRAGSKAIGFATMHTPEEIEELSEVVVRDFTDLLAAVR